MGHVHLPVRAQLRGAWVGLVAVLILATLPLLAASAFSAPVAQTMHPVSYLPLAKGPPLSPYYRIAFVSERDVNQEIYVMKADGSSQINLGGGTYPAWSPTIN